MAKPGFMKPLLKGFSLVLLGDLTARTLGYLLLPVYLHVMDKGQVGTFTYLLTITQLLSQLALMGLYAAQSKLMGEWRSKGSESVLIGGTLLVAVVPVGGLGLIIAFFPSCLGVLMSDREALASIGPLIPLGIVSGGLSFLYANVLLATGRYRMAVTVSVLRTVLSNTAALYVLTSGNADQAGSRLACIWAVDATIFIGFLAHYWRILDMGRWREVPWRRLAVLSFPVWLNALINIPLAGMDRILLERTVAKSDLADYNVAMAIAAIVSVLFSSFNAIWFPAVLAETDVRIVVQRTGRLVKLVIAALSGVGLAVAFATWLSFVLGVLPAKYVAVLPLLAPLLVSQILLAVSQLLAIVFYAMERTWLLLVVSVPVSLVSLGLYLLLIPRFGIAAAVWLQLVPSILLTAGSAGIIAFMLRARPHHG